MKRTQQSHTSRLPYSLHLSSRPFFSGPCSFCGSTSHEAVVDLGSTLTVLSWAAAAAAGLSRDDPRVRLTNDVIAGATGAPVRVSETRITIEMSGARRENMLVNIADLPIFSAIGLPAAAAVLGLDALAPRASEPLPADTATGTGAGDAVRPLAGSRVVLAARESRVWVEE